MENEKMTTRTKKVYKFRKGDMVTLDDIYDIQGLADGDWWEKTGDDLPKHLQSKDIEMSESLVCTKTVKITIIVER
jgi:hypothetical protein